MAGPTKTGVLKRGQDRALEALLVEPTLEKAAHRAQVGVRSIRRWLRDDPVFIAAYQEARRECVRRTTGLLQQRASEAVEVLAALMHDETVSPSVRSSSAKSLLEIAHRAGEIDDQSLIREFERKLEALEEMLFDQAATIQTNVKPSASVCPVAGRRTITAAMTAGEAVRQVKKP